MNDDFWDARPSPPSPWTVEAERTIRELEEFFGQARDPRPFSERYGYAPPADPLPSNVLRFDPNRKRRA